jgi:N-acetyl-anhydromuramoyl-L-alanine amidase
MSRSSANKIASALKVDARTGIMRGARQVSSPNLDERPAQTSVDLIVVHGISLPPDDFGGPWIDALFTNQLPADKHPYFAEVASLRVSSHFLVRRTGEIVQYVPVLARAWHAGVSSFEGRERCNDFSIGVELEGADTIPYEPRQYRALAELIVALCAAYPTLSTTHVVGHEHIAPGRKTDPGPSFDWPRLRALMKFLSPVQ